MQASVQRAIGSGVAPGIVAGRTNAPQTSREQPAAEASCVAAPECPREALQQGCESGSREPGTFVLLALHDGRSPARVTAATDQASAAKR
jgi:hypothetical protein